MNLKITAKAPATCGEYIQGIYKNLPCLVSSPIDKYASVTVREGSGKHTLLPKARRAIELLLDENNIDFSVLDKLDIERFSSIPTGIGMASSTADITAALAAVSHYLNLEVTESDLARIATSIEPSDNLMYKKLNLFNHYTGQIFENYDSIIEAPIIVIESDVIVDTVDFGYETEFKKSEKAFCQVLELFNEGIKQGDLKKIAQASTQSARLNQQALPKPYLEDLILAVESAQGLGLMIGHSGSVLGVIEGEHFKKDKFLSSLDKIPNFNYKKVYESSLTHGGIRVERTFE